MQGMKFSILLFFAMVLLTTTPHAQEADGEQDAETSQKIHQQRIEYLLENLRNPDETLVEQSIFGLELMGDSAVPHLIREITDRRNEKRVRLNAIYAIGRIGQKAQKAVPTLLPFLRHEDADFRGVAVHALGKIGPGAAEAVPLLIPRLRDPSGWVRDGAVWALVQIGTPEAKEAVATYRKEREAHKNDFSKGNVYR